MTILIKSMDHLVVTADDLQVSVEFCSRVLGMENVEFGGGRHGMYSGNSEVQYS